MIGRPSAIANDGRVALHIGGLQWVKSTHYRAAALLSASPQSTDISTSGDALCGSPPTARRSRRPDALALHPIAALTTGRVVVAAFAASAAGDSARSVSMGSI
jgi:hypothetical protein